MSPLFPWSWRNSTMSSVDLLGSQLGDGGGRIPSRCSSRLNQDDRLWWKREVKDWQRQMSLIIGRQWRSLHHQETEESKGRRCRRWGAGGCGVDQMLLKERMNRTLSCQISSKGFLRFFLERSRVDKEN